MEGLLSMSSFNCAKILLYFCSSSREEIQISMYFPNGEDIFFVIVSLVVMVICLH